MTKTEMQVPEGYEARECERCSGTGQRYDSTMADAVCNGGTGRVQCWACSGRGVVVKLTPEGLRAEMERLSATAHLRPSRYAPRRRY
jgi:hypothetical protein